MLGFVVAGVNGAIRRHKDFAAALKGSAFESVRTCRDAFLRGLAQSKDRPCFGYRSKIGSLEVRIELRSGAGSIVALEWLPIELPVES